MEEGDANGVHCCQQLAALMGQLKWIAEACEMDKERRYV